MVMSLTSCWLVEYQAPGVGRGRAAPEGPVVPGHQVGALAAFPVDLEAVAQGHRMVAVAADQAAGLPGEAPVPGPPEGGGADFAGGFHLHYKPPFLLAARIPGEHQDDAAAAHLGEIVNS